MIDSSSTETLQSSSELLPTSNENLTQYVLPWLKTSINLVAHQEWQGDCLILYKLTTGSTEWRYYKRPFFAIIDKT